MRLKPTTMMAANYLLFGGVSLISDQVFRYFKFSGTINGTSFCYYDNFFMGWHYLLCTVFYLLMGAFLLRSSRNLNPASSIWRISKTLTLWTFFIESESVMQFVYVSRDIEYQVEELTDQQMIYAFVVLGVLRWSLALFNLNHTMMALEQIVQEAYGYRITGIGLTINRYQLNLHFGWVSQAFADYLVLHYLAYMAIYSPTSPTYVLKSDDFNHYNSAPSTSSRAIFSASFLLAGGLYAKLARKEVTAFNFII